MTLKGSLGLELDPWLAGLAEDGDVTVVMVGDAGPFLSARAAGVLFTANGRATTYKMKGSGAATDGLTLARFHRSRAGVWRVKVKGEGMQTGAPPAVLQVLLRVGDGCYVAAPALECQLSRSGRSLRCRPPS